MSFCGAQGFGPLSTLHEADFTPCFESVVLCVIPMAVLVLFGIPQCYFDLKRPRMRLTAASQRLYKAKLAIASLLVADIVGRLITYIHGWRYSEPHELLLSFMLLACTAFAGYFSHVAHTRTERPSSVLILFWFLSTLANGVRLRTWVLDTRYVNQPISFALVAALVCGCATLFVLENLQKLSAHSLKRKGGSPETRASFFSSVTFWWLTPLMVLGHSRPLMEEDLWELKQDDKANFASGRFQHEWEAEVKRKRRSEDRNRAGSLLKVCARAFGGPFFFAAVFKLGQDLLGFVQPNLLGSLMDFIANPAEPWQGYLIASTMFLAGVLQTAFLHQYFHRCYETGMRMRAGIVTAIYQKALQLSSASRQRYNTGEIVNMMSVDAQRFMDLTTYLHILWSGPLQICLALFFLYSTLGPSIFAGVGVMLLSIPAQALLATRERKLQKGLMGVKDKRMKMMDQVLAGMKNIKLYGWSVPMLGKILQIRETELSALKRLGVLSSIQMLTYSLTPFLVALVTFATYLATSNIPLTAKSAFVAISLFNQLQFPLMMFPYVISSTIEASVAIRRVHTYLISEEIDPNAVITAENGASSSTSLTDLETSNAPKTKLAVHIKDGDFKWSPEEPRLVLRSINFIAQKGSLHAVIGRVGSGKTSLLSCLLGEMYKMPGSGDVVRIGKVAYVPQQAWIINASLKDNVVFGSPYNEEWYREVIDACCLTQDIQMLPGGDTTEIGERGINLSGGQKQRVSLARAVYSRADVYILDDTLSAVDAHVGKRIFTNVLGSAGLLSRTTRIFATHAIQYLSQCDAIHMLREGSVVEEGSFRECMARRADIYALVQDYAANQEDENAESKDSQDANEKLDRAVSDDHGNAESNSANSLSSDSTRTPPEQQPPVSALSSPTEKTPLMKNQKTPVESPRDSARSTPTNASNEKDNGKSTKLMTTEERTTGQVQWSVYKTYAESCSFVIVMGVIAASIAGQGLQIGSNMWVRSWSEASDASDTTERSRAMYFIGVYGAIGFGSAFLIGTQNVLTKVFCAIISARTLHEKMLQRIMRAPMAFFDTTPLGRIVNRFSKDVYTIDESLPRTFSGFLRTFVTVLGTIIVISVSTPVFLTMIIPMGFLYWLIQKYYMASSRELKRLDSSSRSPIFAHFSETLGGITTIRAYNQAARFIRENELRVDTNQRAYYPSVASNRWLAVRLEFLGSLTMLGSSFFAVITVLYLNSALDSGTVGLSVSYALTITQSLNWMVRQFCEIETNIVSVERAKEYMEIPTEAPFEILDKAPPRDWPQRGEIKFEDYSLRYRPGLDLVLKELEFQTGAAEKIGIVGRTGAGKSSLTLALFRLVEAADGRITIDGLDISSPGLDDVRQRISIIPQESWLFSGSVRENIDPFKRASDHELWDALKAAHLGEVIGALPNKLDAEIAQNGENFSVGQRQLLCLARALLRKTKILILDEATAAIDVETDELVQRTIRKEFKNCTILTIAHRINTVMDSDRVMVLDRGSLVEFETPQNLLQNRESIFYSLAREAKLV